VAGLLQGDLRLCSDSLLVRNFTESIAGGSFRAGFYFNLRNRRDSWFTVTLEQADAARVLAPFPEVARHIEGVLDVHLRGRSGPEWAGSGRVEWTRGRVFGLSVNEWHFPLDFAVAPAEGRGELAIRDSGGRVGGGQVIGRANLRWDEEALSIEGGDLRFFNMDLRTLLSELGHHGSLATGRMSGRAEFSGSNMHSIDDLTALVYASFSETQAMQLPVLNQLTPFMRGTPSNTTFQSGELRGRLANGVVRIQRFGLHSNVMQLFIGGNVTLAGRLNLDVDVRAGGLQMNGPLLALLGLVALAQGLDKEFPALLTQEGAPPAGVGGARTIGPVPGA
jgi:hypothetical protein